MAAIVYEGFPRAGPQGGRGGYTGRTDRDHFAARFHEVSSTLEASRALRGDRSGRRHRRLRAGSLQSTRSCARRDADRPAPMSPVRAGNVDAARAGPAPAALAAAASAAVDRACEYLLNRQTSQGYWVGEIEGDATLAADYVVLQLWLHQPDGDGAWNPPTRARVAAACRRILDLQLEDGGWSLYNGGPANVSASVKAYCGLRIGGLAANDEGMRRAAARIVELGGVEAANSYTKLYLSYFGLFPSFEGAIDSTGRSSWCPRGSPLQRLLHVVLEPGDAGPAVNPERHQGPAPRCRQESRSRKSSPVARPAFPERSATWQRFFLLTGQGPSSCWNRPTCGPQPAKGSYCGTRLDAWTRLERSEGTGGDLSGHDELDHGTDPARLQPRASEPLKRETRTLRDASPWMTSGDSGFSLATRRCGTPRRRRPRDRGGTARATGRSELNGGLWVGRQTGSCRSRPSPTVTGQFGTLVRMWRQADGSSSIPTTHYPDTDDTAEGAARARTRPRRSDRGGGNGNPRGEALEWLASGCSRRTEDGRPLMSDNTAAVLTQLPFSDHNAMLDPDLPRHHRVARSKP